MLPSSDLRYAQQDAYKHFQKVGETAIGKIEQSNKDLTLNDIGKLRVSNGIGKFIYQVKLFFHVKGIASEENVSKVISNFPTKAREEKIDLNDLINKTQKIHDDINNLDNLNKQIEITKTQEKAKLKVDKLSLEQEKVDRKTSES